MCERGLAVFPRVGHFLVLVPEQVAVLDIDGSLEIGHLLGIHLCPDVIIDEEHNTVGMVGEDGNRVWMEVGQQRHHYTSIDIDSPKGHRPSGAIARADGDFIPLADSGRLEEDAEPFNIDSQLCIGEGVAIVIA